MQERRIQSRMAVSYEVFVTGQGFTFAARTRDISPRGAGIISGRQLTPGDIVDLVVVPPEGMLNISVQGTVRYSRDNQAEHDGGHPFLTGVEFSEESRGNIPFMEIQGKELRFEASHSVPIDADVESCYRHMLDFDHYSEWTKVLEKTRILDRYADGRAKQVEFVANAYFRKVRYILEYSYDDANHNLSWVSVGGDFLSITGRYFFTPQGPSRTSSTYQLKASFDFYLPARIVNFFTGRMMRKAMKDFKNYVETKTRAQ